MGVQTYDPMGPVREGCYGHVYCIQGESSTVTFELKYSKTNVDLRCLVSPGMTWL